MNTKKGWKALVLSFFVPGLGQVYARQFKKGILLYILFFLIVFGSRFISYTFSIYIVAVFIAISYLLYNLVGGYKSVRKWKDYEPKKYDKWYFYVLIVFIHMSFFNFLPRIINELTPINLAMIPTPSMDPTLQVGDFLAFKKEKNIKRGEVLVFKYPKDFKTIYIKRCVGLSGDSLQIINSHVFVNGDTLQNMPEFKFRFLVSTNGESIDPSFFEEQSINDYFELRGGKYYVQMTLNQAEKLRHIGLIEDIKIDLMQKGEGDRMIFPEIYKDTWNADYYGSIYIPKSGDIIKLTRENIGLYSKVIEYENESVIIEDSVVLIDGKQVSEYKVKDNYYFVLGDSRHNSEDSRYWGFLPEKLIVGKVMYIYWSKKFDRIGKEII
ncbi:signal peptidase I [Chondrinema litorale]|uniref:signal peptidase I n=1 Tax=Chondrinema litorale TaxID=2994555 RepID=UPI002542B891|nr:signal peptidase I [Chondrinema litorale]UZR93462.1 signal peptidase I [Chondrinema litorale]